MPTPVMTTRLSMSVRPWRRASGVGLDVLDGVADRVDLLGVLVADLDLERLLQRHDQLDGVERVRPQVVHEGGVHRDLLRIDAQLFDDDAFDLVLDALRHLLPSMRDLLGCPCLCPDARRVPGRHADYCSATPTCKDRR